MRSPQRIALVAVVVALFPASAARATVIETAAGGLHSPVGITMVHAPDGDGLDFLVSDTKGCKLMFYDASPSGENGTPSVYAGKRELCRAPSDAVWVDECNCVQIPGDNAKLLDPGPIASLPDGRVVFSEVGRNRVHEVSADGTTLNTTIGSGTCGPAPDSPTALLSANLCEISGIAAHPDDAGRFLVVDAQLGRVMQVNGPTITTVAGGCQEGAHAAFAACLERPEGVAYIGATGEFIVADHDGGNIWKFSTGSDTVAVNVAPELLGPSQLANAYDGGFYFTQEGTCTVEHIGNLTGSGPERTVAGIWGNCASAASGDGSKATDVALAGPAGIASYPGGLLVVERGGNVVRLVNRTSIYPYPPDPTNAANVQFTFESLDQGGAMACQYTWTFGPPIPFGSCASPMNESTYHDVAYQFRVRTEDPTDPQPAVAGFTKDSWPPSAATLSAPSDGADGLAPKPTFTWSSATDSPNPGYDFSVATGIGRYDLLVDGAKVATTAASTTSTQPDAGLSEGSHTWKVRTYDRAGNFTDSGSRSITTGVAPTAALAVAPNRALAGTPVVFDASGSSDPDGPIAKYEWDIDGDGTFETTGTEPTLTQRFTAPGAFTANLRVTDGVGKTATASAPYSIAVPGTAPTSQQQVGVTINNGAQYTNKTAVTLFIKAPAGTTQMLVSNDGGFLKPTTFKPAAQVSWQLDSSGPERLPKTVYVRFLNNALTLDTLTDDIILDERPPVVSQASIGGTKTEASIARAKTWKVRVRASDSNSGVAGVQVTANKRKPGKLLAYKRLLKVKSAARPKFLRAKDRAGNFSRWRKIR